MVEGVQPVLVDIQMAAVVQPVQVDSRKVVLQVRHRLQLQKVRQLRRRKLHRKVAGELVRIRLVVDPA